MAAADPTTQRLESAGVVAVIRTDAPDSIDWIADTLIAAGIEALEVTLTVPGAIDRVAKLNSRLGSEHLVGVGSVRTADEAALAIDAGARYIVSPILNPAVLKCAVDQGVPALPGCFTPTEIASAFDAGAAIAKVFPADVVGMPFFKAVLAPMPDARLMPTGGVTLDNAGDWLRVGAVAVGVGSALVSRDIVETKDTNALASRAHRLLESIAAARTDL